MTVTCSLGFVVSASLNAWKPSTDASLDVDRLVAVAAPVGRLQHLGIAPDLGLGDAAAGVEDADDLPRVLAPPHRRARPSSPLNCCDAARADDDLVRAGREHPALDDLQTSGRTCSAAGVTPRSGTLASVPLRLSGWPTITKSSGDACTPSGALLDARRVRDEPRLLAAEAARHLGVAAGAQDDDGLRIAACPASPCGSLRRSRARAGKTMTTPAMPMTATIEEPRRWPIDRSVTPVTAMVCDSQFMSESNQFRRSASTIFRRLAWSAGSRPVPDAEQQPRAPRRG